MSQPLASATVAPAPTAPIRLPRPTPPRRPLPDAANDDTAAGDREMLRAVLRLSARHGLGAARFADARAGHAFFAGDAGGYRWWRAVTRTLDRALVAEVPSQGGGRALPRG